MSFLWTSNRSKLKYYKLPSPTYKEVILDRISRKKTIIPKRSARRISLFPFFHHGRRLCGGMTVEASLVLPLFLFFFLHLAGYMEMLRLHGKLTFALWEAGKQLSVYAAVAEELPMEVPDVAVSYLYVQNRVEKLLGKEYLDTSPLVYGSRGMSYLSSDYDGDCIDIGLTYQVEPKVTIFPFAYMRLVNQYYGRVWNGYDVTGEMPEYVYVTIYGEVWHETTDCGYLDIEVCEVARGGIGGLRNMVGKKYRLCELCAEEVWETKVYYTPQGDCYHKEKKCSALVRYIRAIEWQENLPYRACSRCTTEGKR